MNDTLATEAVNMAVNVAGAIKGGSIIPGVDNNVASSAITAVVMFVYGVIHRAIEKKKLRKRGKLVD